MFDFFPLDLDDDMLGRPVPTLRHFEQCAAAGPTDSPVEKAGGPPKRAGEQADLAIFSFVAKNASKWGWVRPTYQHQPNCGFRILTFGLSLFKMRMGPTNLIAGHMRLDLYYL